MGQIDVTVLSKKAYPKVVQGSTGVFIKVIEPKEGTNVIVANKPISDLLSAFKP